MKKVIYSFGAMAALMLGACSDDNLQEENLPDVADKDQICYVKVSISTQGMQGRADGDSNDTEFNNGYAYNPTSDPNYEYGTSEESAINNIVFVFYDANGNQVGEKTTMPIEGFELTRNFDSATGNVGDYYTSTVPVTILKGQSKPTQIMAFVNPVQTTGLDADLRSIMTVTRHSVSTTVTGADGKDATYYTMSNSVYYNPSASTGTGICRAAQIPEGGAYVSREEAAADGALSTDIYVERYAAKVRLRTIEDMKVTDITPDNSTTTGSDGGSTTNFTLKFNPGKWALNAIDDLTFVTKVYLEDEVGSYGANAYAYSALNDILNPGGSSWAWNSFANKRSYWALSPSYYKGEYPEVASDWTSQNYDVDYITYNTLTSLTGGSEPGATVYTKETTVGRKGFDSNNPEASIPSVVYGGYYNVVGADGNNIMNGSTPITFYIHTVAGKNNLYFESNADGTSAIPGGTSVMQDIVSHQGTLFVTTTVTNRTTNEVISTSTDQLSRLNLSTVANFLEVAHPSLEVLTNADGSIVKVPSRKVTMQIKKLASGQTAYTNVVYPESGETAITYQLCYGNGSTIVDVEADNYILANKTLTTAALYVDKYNQGAAYFNIPVLHLGWYRAGNANWSDNTSKGIAKNIDWSKVRVGDFGIVRNHVYDILVNSITGLGVGIGNPDDPIIPENNGTTYYVNFRLNVLNWAVVPTQTMDL
ncbi:MAG: fimbria major subunit [Muribaculum sp.]|nr:fimbria major subunit [Muribaculum sp.]